MDDAHKGLSRESLDSYSYGRVSRTHCAQLKSWTRRVSVDAAILVTGWT